MAPSATPPAPLMKSELLAVHALKDVAQDEVWDMLAACPVRELGPGEVLLHAGQANDRMHFVLDGLLSVRLKSPTSDAITTIERGRSVGELSVVDRKPATAFVVAEKRTRILTVTTDAFWKLASASPTFAREVIVNLTAQVRRSTVNLVTSLDANVELEERAMIDGLTGIYNRRWLDETAQRLLAKAVSVGEPFSLLMLDVDHFKKFNDTCGHPAGDAVLVAVAKTMVASVPPTDRVARYGGEEFVVILPKTKLDDARAVAEAARIAISNADVRGTDGNSLPRVTISIGAVEAKGEKGISELIARADGLLYTAKNTGRNRVEG
jgi:two-component system cell cycle response regulator